MSSSTWGISKFEITNRINENIRQFSANLSGYPPIDRISSGNKFQLLLSDLYGASSPGFFKGRIERMRKSMKPGSSEYTITGRDNGVFLIQQPINFPCYQVSTGTKRTRSLGELLGRILKGTGCTAGPEWANIDYSFSNDKADSNWFCGEFTSKKNAIDALLRRYLESVSLKDDAYRWYIDVYGVVRVFNYYASNRPQIVFDEHRKEIETIDFEDNAEQVANDITFIGGEKSDISIRLFNSSSMQHYGRRVGTPVQKTYIKSQSELSTYGQKVLDRQSHPIYVGALTMAGYPPAECGLGIKFPFDPDFGDKNFVITSVQHTGSPGEYKTKLDFSTDSNLVLNPSITDLIEQIFEAKTVPTYPIVAEVQDINTVTNEVQVKPMGDLPNSILRQQVTITTGAGNLMAKKL